MCFPSMTVPNRVFPDSNLPPGSQQWGREQQSLAAENRDAINALARQALTDYRQVNTSVNGAANQTISARNVVYAMPGAYVYREQFSNIAMASQTFEPFGSVTLPKVRNKLRVSAFVSVIASIAAPSDNSPSVYASLTAGGGDYIYYPSTNVSYSTVNGKSYSQIQATHSISYDLTRNSTQVFTPSLSLWASVAVAPDPESNVTFSVYLMYGGNQ